MDLSKLTAKQKRKILNQYRGYSYTLIRNRTILTLILHTDLTIEKISEIKDIDLSYFIDSKTQNQLKRYFKIRRLYFGQKNSNYTFLLDNGSPITQQEVDKIVFDAGFSKYK